MENENTKEDNAITRELNMFGNSASTNLIPSIAFHKKKTKINFSN